jgi:hypothetical protein
MTTTVIPTQVARMIALKGQIVTLITQRDCKVRKGKEKIEKLSKFQCRIGVNYDNIASVKEKRENGDLPAENAGLPWGEWLIFPYVITHKNEYYLRCTVLNNGNLPQVTFLRNNEEITKEMAQVACLASEFRDKEDNNVFTIKISSIKDVNGSLVEN